MFVLEEDEATVVTSLGARLRALRIERGEKQAAVAARLGVSLPTYRKLERGDGSVPIGYWVRLLRLFERLAEFDQLLKPSASLFDEWERRQRRPKARQRVR